MFDRLRSASRPFRNRVHAGSLLAQYLAPYGNRPDVLVLGLPRGGVPVAYEVAKELNVPMDVFLVRKLGLPGHEELAMGAVASGGLRVLNDDVVASYGVPLDVIDRVTARESAELARREALYRGNQPERDFSGQVIILIDDGLATGSTMRAAAKAIGTRGPARIIVAVPVAAPETCEALRREVDEVVCAVTPERFYAVGLWYEDFEQTTDEDVRFLLDQSRKDRPLRARTIGQ